MSSSVSQGRPNSSLDSVVPSGDNESDPIRGQQHDRIQLPTQDTNSNMASSSSANTEITVTQRMIAATGGSLLTSLLGATPFYSHLRPATTKMAAGKSPQESSILTPLE